MNIQIKRFEELTIAELYEILRCRAEVFIVEQESIYQDIDELDKHSTHLYIEDNGKIKAYLRVIDPGVKFAAGSIGRVLVMKEYRGQGLARPIMAKAIEIASSKADTIEIEAQSYLLEFYKSLGFIPISEEFILEGRAHISMMLKF
ncbi:MAG: GNAT family N-acetyltransferase [Bacteroidales bacterium]|nr:GNAT family N-acetyltransferase [Bacteroidales bacterium]